jgi:hypothetical protein
LTQLDSQNPKEEQEEFCECVDPVAKKEVRQSAEFKMRILSKKKTTIKNQTRLVCENCGEIIRHTLHGSYSLTAVSKDQAKRASHQLEMENENFEIPNFNINLVKTNIALNFVHN